MSRYAQGSAVPVDRSKTEIEQVLARYGAEKFGYATDHGSATVGFQVRGRAVRMRLILPDPGQFAVTATGKRRPIEAQRREYEATRRQRWRCLVLVIKAKLEAIESGIATFEDEWLAYLVLGDGTTVGEKLLPALEESRARGTPLQLGLDQRSDGRSP